MNTLIVILWFNPLWLFISRRRKIDPPQEVIRRLNKTRYGKYGECFYNAKIGPIMIRDPYAYPMKSVFAFSSNHLFVIRRPK